MACRRLRKIGLTPILSIAPMASGPLLSLASGPLLSMAYGPLSTTLFRLSMLPMASGPLSMASGPLSMASGPLSSLFFGFLHHIHNGLMNLKLASQGSVVQ